MTPTEQTPPTDLTHYLQTEGRRRAAELAASAARHETDPVLQVQAGGNPPGRPPQSLSEFLHAMGLIPRAPAPPARVKSRRTL